MLKYFVMTVEALISIACLTGMLRGFSRQTAGRPGGIITASSAGAGFIGACIMAYLKNATSKIDTAKWNLGIFAALFAVFILFIIFSALRKKLKKFGDISVSVTAAVLTAGNIFYVLPDIIAYPYTILMTDKSVLSTAFLFKMIGVILGIILIFLVHMAVCSGISRIDTVPAFIITLASLVITEAKQISAGLGIMLNKRMLENISAGLKHDIFEIVKKTSNNSNVFSYLAMAAALAVPVILIIKNIKITEPYDNPAQRRKLVKKQLVARRWASLAIVCLVFGFTTFTAIDAYANRAIELSPVETAEERDGNVYVPFEKVEDGHLHRFGHVTDSGVQIRFIVIKKPNSSSYGIGLDACDICGETGYYEKDGQVVCKLCDVVMNISTIGFKGGCNPIVIPYKIEDGCIVVPIDGLEEYEKTFKNNRMNQGG